MAQTKENDNIYDDFDEIKEEFESNFDFEIILTKSKMLNVAKKLYKTFNEEQKSLFNEYLIKRKDYLDTVAKKYPTLKQ